ncbi:MULTISPECIES: LacI family DNA-binding transcriptional regulator [Pseudoalteromonas]|uniref:LacI family transcriptional regulator n=1 Tax=Pseudoalteromonas ruthenica TaxID=151081 RepID=A0A0F4PJ72_9GAMM|nr:MULTISPECIES: LacI family DNA-binding transcriptional regulator [Pseudoalteromonas]KJY95229.1 LacI family transcriptional regulator [Pseudoalteromonas ruthenica]KJY96178.1 LacI family transcriptional regulator [Pseudoalteromonas ruthenica]MCF2863922.1 LacI family DNA-binding transcriptional regulator [Pseudoalteromonas sp. CNAT2-18]MCG7545849.1 LacI family DNA-binding transcriptional regulator [Pseudoalteromonas sp. MM17-2]MCG7558589.1 LacI family DNA-binding transcriptional regulator [Pseu|tara:strand:- start:3151 stop:4179 length:1029 start_codon:yes stop_codon:yes gene_type:complete
MKVTINDVAKLAGVSMKTVSRVINNEPSVRKKTHDIVMAAVNELNYQPNLAARNLAGTSSYAIGLVYDNPNAYYVIDMQNGVLSHCRKEGYELVIHPCSYADSTMQEELKTMIKRSRIAGLVLTPPLSEQQALIDMLDEMGMHYVRILSGRGDSEQTSPCIYVNDYAAAYEITSHLISLGHRNIAFICGDQGHKSTTERLAGYEQALQDHSIKVREELIYRGDYSFESGVNGAKALLKEGNRLDISAVMGGNDEIAAGALFAARLMDMAIPDELSITGFEDSPFSKQTWPKLTTAHQDNDVISQHAARLLFSKTRGARNQDKEIIRTFTPSLVMRDSSGPLS